MFVLFMKISSQRANFSFVCFSREPIPCFYVATVLFLHVILNSANFYPLLFSMLLILSSWILFCLFSPFLFLPSLPLHIFSLSFCYVTIDSLLLFLSPIPLKSACLAQFHTHTRSLRLTRYTWKYHTHSRTHYTLSSVVLIIWEFFLVIFCLRSLRLFPRVSTGQLHSCLGKNEHSVHFIVFVMFFV